jgi:photosystem II stability/assembly factor-like uncharacterized protein
VGAVAVDPHDPARLYLGGADGLFYSDDAGRNWSLLSQELGYPHLLLVDPYDPTRLYAARRDLNTFLPIPGVYRSTDAGVSWQCLAEGLDETPIFSLVTDPMNRGILYAGSWAGRVYKSIDGGEHWAPSSGSPRACPQCAAGTVGQLLVHPLDGDLYALVDHSGTFRSTDGGESWSRINDDGGQMAIDPQRGHLYLAGRRLWCSVDNGATWQDLSAGLPFDSRTGVYALSWIAVNPDPLVLYTRHHRSIDGGESWGELPTPAAFVPRLLVPGAQPILYGSLAGEGGRYEEVVPGMP